MFPRRPFYFLRHGQTDWNRDGLYQGITDVPLNALGVAQAKDAADTLAAIRIDRIVASPLSRALKTAAIVAEKCNLPILVERGLIERGFGSFEGLSVRETKASRGVPLDQNSRSIMPADADRWDEILERVPPVIGSWLTKYPEESLLFVAHGGVFDAVLAHLVGPRTGPESKHATPYLAEPTATGWSFAALVAG